MTRAGSAHERAPLLEVQHLTMRFGGLVAIDDLSLTARQREITAIIGPNGAGKTTVFNCLTGFYKPTVGQLTFHARRPHPAARADGGLPHRPRRRRAHLPEHPAVRPDERAREPDRGAAQRADAGVRLHGARRARLCQLSPCRGGGGRARARLAGAHRPGRPGRLERRQPALRPAAQAGDRAGDVHRAQAALPGRAGRRAQPARDRRARQPAARTSATSSASASF